MLIFPKFKSTLTYLPYKKQALVNWESMIYKTGFVFLMLELARLIEDFNHGQYTDWSKLWIAKTINYSFYFSVTFGRFFLFKIMGRWKRIFIDISEFLILLVFILIIVFSKDIPMSTPDPNPLWGTKENLRSYAQIICLCFSFYNWILPVLIIATNVAYGSYMYTKLLPGFGWLYLPTYVTIVFCIAIFCYYIEKIRRIDFETHFEANNKEKVWKEILNEFPEGTLIINQKRETLYVNHAFYSILNLDFHKGIEELNELTSIKEISIEGFTADSSAFGIDHNPITKFQELQEIIWSRWSSLVDYFTSPLPHDEYKIYKGQCQVDEIRTKTFEIKFTIRRFGGQNVALFIFSDVSERLLVNYLKQSIDYKNRLLASVSHELRTPLNGNINFILEAIHDSTVPKHVKDTRLIPAMRSAKYLLSLINDILDFSQIQARNLRLVPTVKNIVETVKEAMELVEIQAKKKGLSLNLNLLQRSWQYEIKTDHNRVLQIIANLLSNALKFTFSGGITISIKPDNNKTIRIEVEDTGIGIKSEDQSKLFKAFGKLDLGGKNYINSQGVGLGLVISNSLAGMLGPKLEILNPSGVLGDEDEENYDGHGIHFESHYGKGSKFWFRIADQNENKSHSQCFIPSEGSQIHDVPESIVTDANAPLLAVRQNCGCPDFLVADDDAFNILTLETMLNNLGYKSECAYNGQQALDLVIKRISSPCSESCQMYKMIFLDCNMPIMDGYECAINLKKLFSEKLEYACPIIACTAATHQAERDKALESGMKDFVTKPINKGRIQELINSYCLKAASNSDSL